MKVNTTGELNIDKIAKALDVFFKTLDIEEIEKFEPEEEQNSKQLKAG